VGFGDYLSCRNARPRTHVHGKAVSTGQAEGCLREFFHIGYWLARTYARGAKPLPDLEFHAEALPRVTQVERSTLRQLQEVARRFKETVEARNAAEAVALRVGNESS